MSMGGKVRPETELQPSLRAEKEAAGISAGTLRRTEEVRANIHRGGLVVFWTLVMVGISLTLVWAWHLGAPAKWRFLTPEQLSELQKTLLAAVGSSAATQLSRKWLGDQGNRIGSVD